MSFATHEHWEAAFGPFQNWYRVRDHFELINGYPFKSENFNADGIGQPLVRIRDLLSDSLSTFFDGDEGKNIVVKDGDIAIGMDGDFNSVTWSKGEALLNQRVCALRAKNQSGVDPRMLGYQIPVSLQIINDLTPWSTVKHLSSLDVLSLRFPKFDLATQRQIADFLDRETARIDLLIEKKQRLVALLGDRYERHRDQVLTAHDEHLPQQSMRWLIRVGSGDFISNEEMSPEQSPERPIPVIGGNGVMAYTNRSNTPTHTLVVGRVGALCGNVHLFEHRSWVTDNALIVRLTSKQIIPRYAYEILKSAKLNEKANKSAQPLITGETVKKVMARLPSKDEQERRVRKLAELSTKVSKTTQAIFSSIDRLKEYRAALITAAVTGQIDVQTYARSGSTDRRLDAIQEEMGA